MTCKVVFGILIHTQVHATIAVYSYSQFVLFNRQDNNQHKQRSNGLVIFPDFFPEFCFAHTCGVSVPSMTAEV